MQQSGLVVAERLDGKMNAAWISGALLTACQAVLSIFQAKFRTFFGLFSVVSDFINLRHELM